MVGLSGGRDVNLDGYRFHKGRISLRTGISSHKSQCFILLDSYFLKCGMECRKISHKSLMHTC